jgi:ectoine hydroxylase-related dioxygenase (phytanoyl-CoA dioxygenase family)
MTMPMTDLPNLDDEYPVTEEQVAQYRRDGHVLLRGVCSPEEIAAYRTVIHDAVRRLNKEERPLEERDTYGKAFLQTMNLWEEDEAARKFVFGKRFAQLAARLMGVDAIRLYHDQALFKEAHGGLTPWHQDQYYWPLGTDHTITMWMPTVDATPEMGTMNFASGSHKEGFLGHMEISDESAAKFQNYVDERGYRITSSGAMNAGDATFHSGWTLHSAPGNSTDRTREAFTIIYYADGARLMTPDNKNRQNDLERWHPGQQPGELAASRLNPVLWKK